MPAIRLCQSLMLTALLLAPVLLAGEPGQRALIDRSCILDPANTRQSLNTAAPNDQLNAAGFELGVLDPDRAADDIRAEIDLSCLAGTVESMTVHLPLQSEAVVTFLLTNRTSDTAQFSISEFSSAAGSNGWLTIDPASGQTAAGTRIPISTVLRVPEGLIPGSTHQFLLEFTVGDGAHQSTIGVPVRLEIQEERPMFRNRFEVDPVLGQFSFLTP